MNDDFLIQFRKSPRTGFAENLYKKITKPAKQSPLFGTLKLSFGILVAVLAITMMFIPNARAAIQSAIKEIAGLYFNETTKSPVICWTNCEPRQVLGIMDLEKARAAVSFPLDLPTWTPEKYWLNPRIKVFNSFNNHPAVEIKWLTTGFTEENHWSYEQEILLMITQDQDYPLEEVGIGSVTEIDINGQPAALIHGSWQPYNKDWDYATLTRITWARDEVRYLLFAGFIEPSSAISDEDLIRMAESIP